MILQELLQQLHKYHLNPRKSCSLNTSQGFQNAKMIYFQWNSKHKPTMSDNCLRQQTCLCYTYVHNYYGSWLSEAAFTLVPKHAQTKHVSKIISPISSNCQMLFFTNLYYSSRIWILWHLLQVTKVWSFNETLWSCQCECSIRKVICSLITLHWNENKSFSLKKP